MSPDETDFRESIAPPDSGQEPGPTPLEVDAWVEALWQDARTIPCPMTEESVYPYHRLAYPFQAVGANRYLRFAPEGREAFLALWQPALASPAPLLVHTSGYGAEISFHPEMAAAGFHVLHIQPLGYITPTGWNETLRRNGEWPVLEDTASSGARGGYRTWLLDCLQAVEAVRTWPQVLPDRLSFFGTSQGGGGSLLLGSLFRSRGARAVAADQPFLTGFSAFRSQGAYKGIRDRILSGPDPARAIRSLGFVDTFSHVHRLDLPVLLTAGDADTVCPPDAIEALWRQLSSHRALVRLSGMAHGYNREFVQLAMAWFRMYG